MGKMNSIFKIGLAVGILWLSSCREQSAFYSNVLRSDVFVQEYDDARYDFLWVMDNSGSMAPRREFVRDNIGTFLDILTSRKAIDSQMAVVTTDMFTHAGDLVENGDGLSVVKSATSSDPATDFASIVDAVSDSMTSFWEQGLESAYQAIYQHKAEFSRDGVPLVVIFLTDEDDWSCEENCFGVEPENNPDWVAFDVSRYTDYFSTVKSAEESVLHVFPIVGVDSERCEVASVGTRYMNVNLGVGGFGVDGSICTSDLEDSFNSIARIIADRGTVFTLSSEASGQGINVYVDGALVTYSPDNYVYDASTNSIVFTGAAPRKGSVIEVTYLQATE